MDIIKIEDIMRDMARGIDYVLQDSDMPKGFTLIIFDFDKAGAAHYISNANREDMIKSLRETIERFEKGQTISAVTSKTMN